MKKPSYLVALITLGFLSLMNETINAKIKLFIEVIK